MFHDTNLLDAIKSRNADVHDFFRLLAVCHTVMAEKKNGILEYKAQSPDEAALVSAAQYFGFTFQERSPSSITIDVLGRKEVYELLYILDFNNIRKRMSVILKKGDKITLFCKGADNVIFERLKDGSEEIIETTSEYLNKFANEGLRTLCLSMKEVDKVTFNNWQEKYKESLMSFENRDVKVDNLCNEIEKEMTLLGATAIEDKLQDDVPKTIENLALAGMKLWVLTGDKQGKFLSILIIIEIILE